MNYEDKYKEALERAKKLHDSYNLMHISVDEIEQIFPELAESEDERIRKWLLGEMKIHYDFESPNLNPMVEKALAWLEKQGVCDIDYPQKYQDNSQLNGCIVLEDFNGDEGFYKLNLAYLNKKQVEEVEEMVRTWNKESKASNENIKACVGMCLTDANEQRFKDYNTTLKDCLDWLEKQKLEQKKISEYYRTLFANAIGRDASLYPIKEEQKPWKVGANAYFTPEQKPEWSESDKQNINLIVSYLDSYIEEHNDTFGADECKSLKYWLKSLPERFNLQPKQEWSEEDEACIRNLESIIYYDKKLPNDTRVILGEFLSNLRPQPQGTYKQVIHTIFGMLKDKDFYEIQPSHRVSLLNDIRVKCKDAIECAPILDEPSWKPSEDEKNKTVNRYENY